MEKKSGLLPWQGRFLSALARPGVTTAALSVARSNGKSWLAAKLARDYLLGDRRDTEAVIVASSYAQAKVLFRYAVGMVREAGHDPSDRKAWRFRDYSNVALLRSLATGQAIRALGCDPKRAHGRVFGLALMDEPAQWPGGTRDAMLAAIDTGAGKVGSRIVGLEPARSGRIGVLPTGWPVCGRWCSVTPRGRTIPRTGCERSAALIHPSTTCPRSVRTCCASASGRRWTNRRGRGISRWR